MTSILENTKGVTMSTVGISLYMSPEMIKAAGVSFSTDMWSLGCILYEMCSLKKAYINASGNEMELINTIADGPVPSLPEHYSNELKTIYSALMQKEPEKRPRIFEILQNPMLNERAKKLLDSKFYSSEFDHTQIHGYNLRAKYKEMKDAEKKA